MTDRTFFPSADSFVQTITATSSDVTLGALGTNPALRLIRTGGQCQRIWIRFAVGATTAAASNSILFRVAEGEEIIVGIKAAATHAAFLADGFSNTFNVTQGNVLI